MDEFDGEEKALQTGATLLGLLSALPLLGFILGSAAWNGVNLAMAIYSAAAVIGSAGLLLGIFTAFSRREIFTWITGVCSAIIAILGFLLLAGFLFNRTKETSLNDSLMIGHMHAPLILLYGFAVSACAGVTFICVRRIRIAGESYKE